jgi:hypothetical protein
MIEGQVLRQLEREACEKEQRDKGAQAARDLSDLLNTFDAVAISEGFVEELTCRTHRTLQQGVMRDLIINLIKAWAEMGDEGRHDLRNEATVKLCQKILPAVEEEYFPYV